MFFLFFSTTLTFLLRWCPHIPFGKKTTNIIPYDHFFIAILNFPHYFYLYIIYPVNAMSNNEFCRTQGDPSSSSSISFVVGSSKTASSGKFSETLANQLNNQIIRTPTHKVKSKMKVLSLASTSTTNASSDKH